MRRPKQTVYVRSLSEFCAMSQEMERRGAEWLGYDEISYRRRQALREMWEFNGIRVDIVLRIPKRKGKRSLDLEIANLLH